MRRRWTRRAIGAVVLAAALCVAATVSAQGKPKSGDSPYVVRTHKLSNGMVVLVEQDARAPVASFNLWYRAGSRNDPPGKSGTSALAMRMMMNSTQHVPASAYTQVLLRAGAYEISDSVGRDRASLSTVLPADRLALPMWLWSDQMGFFVPQATEESLARSKDSMRAEWGHKVNGALAASLYAAADTEVFEVTHPYHRPMIAEPAQVDAVRLRDVQEFHQKWFVPDNAVLSVAGLVEPKDVFELAEKYFGPIPKSNLVQPQAPAPSVLADDIWIEGAAPVARTEVRICWPTPAWETPGDFELDAAASVLSGSRVAWLAWDLVDKQMIAEKAWARQYSREWGSVFTVSVTIANGHTPEEGLQAVDATLDRLAGEGPHEDEFANATREFAIKDMFAFERPRARAQRHAHCQLRYGDHDCLLARIVRFDEMKAAEMQKTLKEMRKSKRVVLIVRPSPGAPMTGVVTSKARRSKS